jgi:hypothetical protein
MMTMMTRLVNRNQVKLLVATGSIIVIVALFWTAQQRSRKRRRGRVAASHLRCGGGASISDAVFEDKSMQIHHHTQPFVSYFDFDNSISR